MDWTTKPGFQVASTSFIAVFIAGSSEELEKRRDWHIMMMVLLYAFERFPRDMARVGCEAAIKWIHKNILGENIREIGVEISNDKFSQKPGDKIKAVVHVHLIDYNDIKSTVIFEVKKKPQMKTLQILAAETISSCISKKEDIEFLEVEVPKQLLTDLKKAYEDSWRVDGRSISLSKSCSPSRHPPSRPLIRGPDDVVSDAEAEWMSRHRRYKLIHYLYGFCCIEY